MAVQKRIAGLIPRMRALPQPIIAAVNGPAAGGGLALVLGSDIRLAARTARFIVAFIRVGVSGCDIGTSWLLPRLVGVARAHELMLTGREFDADEALRIGVVTHLFEEGQLMEAALAKAGELLAHGAWAVSLTKEAMWASLEIPGCRPPSISRTDSRSSSARRSSPSVRWAGSSPARMRGSRSPGSRHRERRLPAP